MMDTGPSLRLESLAVDIIETIVGFLDFKEIYKLRLTSRCMAAKVSQGRFRDRFRVRTLHLTKESLSAYSRFVETSEFACLLQDVTIAGIVHVWTPSPTEAIRKEIFELLSDIFTNLREKPAGGRLRALRTRVISDQDQHPTILWASKAKITANRQQARRHFMKERFAVGGDTFKVTMLALQKSELPVEKIDIFSGGASSSLANHLIAQLPDLDALSPSLRHVKTCGLSLTQSEGSMSPSYYIRQPVTDELPVSDLDESAAAIARFLGLMTQLEHVDLRWFNRRVEEDTGGDREENFVLEPCFYLQIPSLRTCSLRGLSITQSTLLHFLQNTTARDIRLQDLYLYRGSYEPIFETLTRQEDSFTKVHLDSIFEKDRVGNELVRFQEHDETKYASRFLRYGKVMTEVIMEGEGVRQPLLQFTFARGGSEGTN